MKTRWVINGFIILKIFFISYENLQSKLDLLFIALKTLKIDNSLEIFLFLFHCLLNRLKESQFKNTEMIVVILI